MSQQGGGGMIIVRHEQKVAMSSDMKALTITNDSAGDITLSPADINGLASTYCADPNTSVGLSRTDEGWAVTSGPSE